MENLGRAQKGLGRDASPIEANTAKVIAFDDRRLEAKLARADSGHIAAGAGASDQDVKRSIGHARLRYRWVCDFRCPSRLASIKTSPLLDDSSCRHLIS